MLMHMIERVVASFWVGSLWAVGYLAVPLLFVHIDDKVMAGAIAGDLFTIQSYVGYICGGLLFLIMLTTPIRRLLTILILVVMVALTLYGQFEIQPQMAALKAQGLIEGSDAASEFGRLHGMSAIGYLLTSILGFVLLFLGVWSTMRAGVEREAAKAEKLQAAAQKQQEQDQAADEPEPQEAVESGEGESPSRKASVSAG